jgi:hypothetical protein
VLSIKLSVLDINNFADFLFRVFRKIDRNISDYDRKIIWSDGISIIFSMVFSIEISIDMQKYNQYYYQGKNQIMMSSEVGFVHIGQGDHNSGINHTVIFILVIIFQFIFNIFLGLICKISLSNHPF